MSNKFWNALEKYGTTENGALTLKTSSSALVDFFAMGGALRSRSEKEITDMFEKALEEDAILAIKILFYIRDCRGGLGEKRTFRVCLKWLVDNYKNSPIEKLIDLTAEYGSWKDVFEALDSNTYNKIVGRKFVVDVCSGKPTLMEKYMPSIGGGKNKKAEEIASVINMTPKQYRQELSALRKQLNLVETHMSSGNWDKITYGSVPSKAMLTYNRAFGKHDFDRFNKYIADVNSGKAKINASVLYPYEIFESVFQNKIGDNEATALWNALPDYTDSRNAIVMADVSGSMSGRPMAVSVSLALYFAERNKGHFNGKFMTFSGNPEIVTVKGDTLRKKMANITQANWDMNTDIQKAFEKILNSATRENIPQSEMPETLYIISDMEFDSATRNRYDWRSASRDSFGVTNFEAIKEKYTIAGYELPRIVFWNVASRQDNIPVGKDEINTVLVSGASPSIFKFAVSPNCSPEGFMLDVINNDRYKLVDTLFN